MLLGSPAYMQISLWPLTVENETTIFGYIYCTMRKRPLPVGNISIAGFMTAGSIRAYPAE